MFTVSAASVVQEETRSTAMTFAEGRTISGLNRAVTSAFAPLENLWVVTSPSTIRRGLVDVPLVPDICSAVSPLPHQWPRDCSTVYLLYALTYVTSDLTRDSCGNSCSPGVQKDAW